MKRFLAFVLCALLAASLCSCKPSSSAPEVSSEATVSSLPASSAEKLSSAPPASSEAAEKLELEIDRTLGLDTISVGQYINQQGKLIVDRKYFDDADYQLQFTHLGLSPETVRISSAMDYAWDVFVINGKIHVTDNYRPCLNSDAQTEWKKERTAIKSFLSSLPEVRSVFVLDAHSSGFLGAVFSDGSVGYIGSSTVTKPDGWNVVSACYYGTAADDGILGLKPDGTFCFEPVSGESDSDFSKISNVAAFSGNPFQYITQKGGFITCLLNDGTLIVTDGEAKYTAAQNVVKIDTSAQIYMTSDNSVYRNNQKIGTVSDWHNVAYLKQLNGDTVVAAMKNGTVEVVSPGDAPKALLDFLASVKDLKVAWE